MAVRVTWTLLSPQAAQSVNKALEQFVKPEQLDGENSYKCSKYAGRAGRCGPGLELWAGLGAAGGLGQARPCRGLDEPLASP